jgi:hypothetical protein
VSKGRVLETMVVRPQRKIYSNEPGYKLWVTENIGNLDILRKAIMLKYGILTCKF